MDSIPDKYRIVETSEGYAVCLRDSSSLWLDFRKSFNPKQRSEFRGKKHICLYDDSFDEVIECFWHNARLMYELENMKTTSQISQEFGTKTTPGLEKELSASFEVPGRRCRFSYAVHSLALALRENELKFSEEQAQRYREIYDTLEEAVPQKLRKKLSCTDLDLLVSGIVCAETIGATAIYTNDKALLNILPFVEGLVKDGSIRIKGHLDFYTTIGLERTTFEKDCSVRPLTCSLS